jgi:hypothetical protein
MILCNRFSLKDQKMNEISDVKSWIACVDTRCIIRLFDDILFNVSIVFLILNALIFEIIDKQKL